MPTPRFLTLDDVAEILNVSWSQAYALVRRKELIAIQIGGRGQWRVEKDELERFIQQKYAEARGTTPPAEHETEPEPAPPSDLGEPARTGTARTNGRPRRS
jgi:excisionase family DNA binding protein